MANNVYVSDASLANATAGWPALHSIYGGCNMLVGLDMDGKLCFTTDTHAYLLFWKWDDMKMLSLDKHHNAVVFGLKHSGTCMISKNPFAGYTSYSKDFAVTRLPAGNNGFSILLEDVHALNDIVQIATDGAILWALDKNGNVHGVPYGSHYWWYYGWDSDEYEGSINFKLETAEKWHNIRRLLIAEEDVLVAQKNSGELVYAGHTGDLFGTFGEKDFHKLQDCELIDACGFYGGESKHFAFLDAAHTLHCKWFSEAEEHKFSQIVGLDHSFIGLTDAGTLIQFQGVSMDISNWPRMKQISIGRKCQHRYDNLYLAGISAD